MLYRSLVIGILLLLSLATPAFAQPTRNPNAKTNSGTSGNSGSTSTTKGKSPSTSKRLTVSKTVEPAFRIEPIVQKMEGSKGDILPFQFQIESANRDSTIEIRGIGLRQDLTGMIMHDEQAIPPDLIEFENETNMLLRANEKRDIRGIVRVPREDANFYSFGILVRDLGSNTDLAPRNNNNPNETRAGIKFVTQYILRCDINIPNSRGEIANRLVLESANIIPVEGRPVAQTIVSNPTDTPFEFEVRVKLDRKQANGPTKPLRLVMPVRMGVETEERFIGRVLPHSRVRMEEFIPEAVLGGDYQIKVELLANGKPVNSKSFSSDVEQDDFPAQDVVLAQAGESIIVTPAQLELSQRRGGKRLNSFFLKNVGTKAQNVNLSTATIAGKEISDIMMKPDSFQLAPGASRKVSLTISTPKARQESEYGYIHVKTSDKDAELIKSLRLPLALLAGKVGEAKADLSELAWDVEARHPSFVATVINEGNEHLVLDAELMIEGEDGRRLVTQGGFGQWLLPSESTLMRFRLPAPLNPGNYSLTCTLRTGGDPIVLQQNITVSDADNAVPPAK